MDNQLLVITLRLIHILGGIFWVGAALILGHFILPAADTLGPAIAGPMLREIGQVRKLPIYLNIAGLLTMLSGIGLYWRMMSLTHGTWAHSTSGQTFGLGAAIAIITAIIGNLTAAPAGRRLGALGNEIAAGGGVPTPEQGAEMVAIRTKLRKSSQLLGILLVISAAAMSIARYV